MADRKLIALAHFMALAAVLEGQAAEVARPASLDEIAQVIDLRTFPKPPGAKPQASNIAASVPCLGVVRYDVPGSPKAILDFYSAKMLEAGWSEAPKTDKRIEPRYLSADGGSLTYVKHGFLLWLSIHKSSESANIGVQIHNYGNVDTRSLPQLAGATREQDQPQMTRYSTTETVATATDFTRDQMRRLGWQEINRRPGHERKDVALLQFRQRAILVEAHISIPPDLNGRTAVNLSTRVLNDELPTPAQANDVELEDGDYDIVPPLELTFRTSMPMEEIVDFYRKELAARGWKFRAGAGMMQKNAAFYYFDGVDKDEMRLDLKQPADQSTQVVLRRVTAATIRKERLAEARLREQAQKELVVEQARRKQRGEMIAAQKKAAEEKEIASRKSRPRDIPVPADATDVVADTFFHRLTFFTKSDRAEVFGFYREQLLQRGWTEQMKSSPLITGYARFGKGKATLTIQTNNRRGKPLEVQLGTRGVEWDLPKSASK